MIADSARRGVAYAEQLLTDISDQQCARFASPGGQPIESNHPAFILGHLSLYPCRVVDQLGDDAGPITPSDDYQRLFSPAAKCVDDPERTIYPAIDDLSARFFAAYRGAIDSLGRAADEQFATENPNEAMRAKFATMGSMHAFYLGGHLMVHLGQLSAWRRAYGLGSA